MTFYLLHRKEGKKKKNTHPYKPPYLTQMDYFRFWANCYSIQSYLSIERRVALC